MFKDLIDLLQNVSQGDSEALEKSGMEDSKLGKPETLKLSANDLRAEHYKACLLQTSAAILGMNMLGLLCKDYINVLNFLAQKCHQFELQETTLEPQDYADTLEELVREINDNFVPLAKAFSKERKDDFVALPDPDPPVDEKSDSPEATEIRIQPGSSNSSINYDRKCPRESSPAPNPNSESTSRSPKKANLRTTTPQKPNIMGKTSAPSAKTRWLTSEGISSLCTNRERSEYQSPRWKPWCRPPNMGKTH